MGENEYGSGLFEGELSSICASYELYCPSISSTFSIDRIENGNDQSDVDSHE